MSIIPINRLFSNIFSSPDGKDAPLEISLVIIPRPNGINNGPDGNYVLGDYVDPLLCPKGITVSDLKNPLNGNPRRKTVSLHGWQWSVMVYVAALFEVLPILTFSFSDLRTRLTRVGIIALLSLALPGRQ